MRRSGFLKLALVVAACGAAAWLGWAARDFREAPVAGSGPDSGFARVFGEWSGDPALAGAAVGFCLLDESGEVVFASPLAGTALCPASALKTLTTGAALEVLGPGFRFETVIAGTAVVDGDGTLAGDLVLRGGGDPTLSVADLDAMARELLDSGLKRVNGVLRADASVFSAPPVSDHWNWGDVGNAYGAGAFGVNVNHNRVVIRFDPGESPGEPAVLREAGPLAEDTRLIHHVVTGPPGSGDRVMVYSEPWGRTIRLSGSVPAGEPGFTIGGANPDPPATGVEHLRKRLEEGGVSFGDESLGTEGELRELLVHRSAPLEEIIPHLHRVSDNLEAQCLFLTLGRDKREDPASALRAFWEEAGVEFTGLRIEDGSGLARAARIRPLDLARCNHFAKSGTHGGIYHGSLSRYLDDRVRSKLGAMSGVRTEAGFLKLADGRELTFALMANGLGPEVDFWALRGRLLDAITRQDG